MGVSVVVGGSAVVGSSVVVDDSVVVDGSVVVGGSVVIGGAVVGRIVSVQFGSGQSLQDFLQLLRKKFDVKQRARLEMELWH